MPAPGPTTPRRGRGRQCRVPDNSSRLAALLSSGLPARAVTAARGFGRQTRGHHRSADEEVRAVMRADADPSAVLFTHPVKPAGDIARARRAGMWRFAADSDTELAKIARYSPGAAVLLCIDTGAGGTVGDQGKFGIQPGQAPGLAYRAQNVRFLASVRRWGRRSRWYTPRYDYDDYQGAEGDAGPAAPAGRR